MGRRLQFHDLLLEAAGPGNRVYFQPPSNEQMTYPCIRYQRNRTDTKFAANSPYRLTERYTVTVIDRDPESEISERVVRFEMCTHSASFAADSLNHDVFDIYF